MKLNPIKGFTLVELMLVVLIIGMLVAMVVPRLMGKSDRAKEVAARTDIEANLSNALDMYRMDVGSYPTTEVGIQGLLIKPTDSRIAPRWKGPYIKKKAMDPWGNPYDYRYPSQHNMDYDLMSFGGDGKEGGGDDIGNWDETS